MEIPCRTEQENKEITKMTQDKISIIGIGRVGLPLALAFAEKDCFVYGVDVDKNHIRMVNSGKMPFLEEGADALLEKHVGKNFTATNDVQYPTKNSDTIILTLGTPVDEHLNPIFSQIEAVIRSIVHILRPGQLIVLRSTVSPGTTEYIKRYIEKNTKWKIGQDIFLAFCPERIAEGKSLEEIPLIPQIIGTLDKQSAQKAEELFTKLTATIHHSDARSVELAKLYCNMYRYINFAIANEFMMIAKQHDREIHNIINLVNSGYKRGGLKTPGFTAGPCLYKDGFFLVNKSPFTELITTSWKINESIPAYLIEQIKKEINLIDKKVAILGLSFKKNIDDNRNSLSYRARKIFVAEGAKVTLHDPFIEPGDLNNVLKGADVVLIAMNHDLYKKEITIEKLQEQTGKETIVCDIWNMLNTGKVIFKTREPTASELLDQAALEKAKEKKEEANSPIQEENTQQTTQNLDSKPQA
jgi:UDP-N-acetyl-D-mannosaminuronic acid dehydrogenase